MKSSHDKVRAIHLAMASAYDLRARQVQVNERGPSLRVVTAA